MDSREATLSRHGHCCPREGAKPQPCLGADTLQVRVFRMAEGPVTRRGRRTRHRRGGRGPPSPSESVGPPSDAGLPRFHFDSEDLPPPFESRSKEADRITIGSWPPVVAAYRQWRSALAGEIVVGSQQAGVWI